MKLEIMHKGRRVGNLDLFNKPVEKDPTPELELITTVCTLAVIVVGVGFIVLISSL